MVGYGTALGGNGFVSYWLLSLVFNYVHSGTNPSNKKGGEEMTELEKQNLIVSQIEVLRKVVESCRTLGEHNLATQAMDKMLTLIARMK
ncbi:hypothetical protein QE357_002988 [Siphonobacter sp. BAB-5404]|nr:hypothetical protein [Siphonobacter sp. SORGH_AS_0500]